MSVIAVHNCDAFCARLRPNRARKPAPGILTGCEPRRRSERAELDTELSLAPPLDGCGRSARTSVAGKFRTGLLLCRPHPLHPAGPPPGHAAYRGIRARLTRELDSGSLPPEVPR